MFYEHSHRQSVTTSLSNLAYFLSCTYLVRWVFLREQERNVRRDETGAASDQYGFRHGALVPRRRLLWRRVLRAVEAL